MIAFPYYTDPFMTSTLYFRCSRKDVDNCLSLSQTFSFELFCFVLRRFSASRRCWATTTTTTTKIIIKPGNSSDPRKKKKKTIVTPQQQQCRSGVHGHARYSQARRAIA